MDTFCVGDRVEWNEKWVEEWIRQEYGNGPFSIIEVIPVPPAECTCGAEEFFGGDDAVHSFECQLENPSCDSVGHHQWVKVADPDGKPVGPRASWDTNGTPGSTFSGVYFKKVQ